MYPQALRHVIFPVLDRVNHTRITETLGFLEKSQWYSAEQLAELQQNKLRGILAWVRESSPFYRNFWETCPDDRRAASLHPELQDLPVITKQDLRSALSEFPLSASNSRVFTVHTSGSTGEPMKYHRSAEQESWFWALRFRMWQWGGYRIGEPYLTLNLNPRTAARKRIQDVIFRCSYHGFNANSHDVDTVIRDLDRRRVKHLNGYASSLYLLSRALLERNIEVPGVKSVLATGDTLFPSYRETIKQAFKVDPVDYYGAGGEGFHLASQCEERAEYHLHTENSVIEILKDGRPAEPGEMGEIVVTQLDNRAMPLVRYSTQDVAVASENVPCACGRQLPLLHSVQGRVPDIVFAPDGSALVVHFFTILFEYLEGIRQFQVVQRVPDRIVIRIVPENGFDRAAAETRIREDIARATHGSLGIDYDYVEDIPLSPSLKRRLVISEVLPAPLSVASGQTEDSTTVR
jgi:phenylacetate-CoA ligase